mmetsp:Transcript_45130/g.84428  ORF Transcript_45130/g.84428 Transcript_45130/m.84428 type:complete len:100 (-) Transcript_45130:1336-1635(-)
MTSQMSSPQRNDASTGLVLAGAAAAAGEPVFGLCKKLRCSHKSRKHPTISSSRVDNDGPSGMPRFLPFPECNGTSKYDVKNASHLQSKPSSFKQCSSKL